MDPLIFGELWPLPYYDEPEDNPDGFPAWLAEHGGKGPLAIGYWNIAKAKRLGVWVERGVTFLYFNWYPACSAVPWWGRIFYVPYLAIQARFMLKSDVPVRLTLWKREPGLDELGNRYWRSDRLNSWSWFWFKWLLWPRETGQVWF